MRPIAISLSPNTESDDYICALKNIINFTAYNSPEKTKKFENKFSNYFGKEYYSIGVTSGRGALYIILKSLDIKNDDEVLLQAFTCSAAVNPVIWVGAKPVYLDINEQFNIDLDDLRRKITKKTKAIIVQHSFGIPAQIQQIRRIADEYGIYLIEDCAVSLGAKVGSKKMGTFGDVSFFSFGRDKIISSVWGGIILTKDTKLLERIGKLTKNLNYPNRFWTFQQLLHPLAFSIILPTYHIGLGKYGFGKIILFLLQRLRLLSFPVSDKEKKGEKPDEVIKKIPGALADVAYNQFEKLERFNNHRKKIAKLYHIKLDDKINKPGWSEDAVWLRYPIIVQQPRKLLNYFQEKGILLGDWYKLPIYPADDLNDFGYESDCDRVDSFSGKTINLPTYPTLDTNEALKIINMINQWHQSK